MLSRLEKAVKKYELGIDEKTIRSVKSQCVYEEISVKGLNFKKIRDVLILTGTILEEDEQNRIYVGIVKGGLFNSNPSIVVLNQQEDMVVIGAFAREGIIKQKTAIKAIERIKSAFRTY